MLHKTIDRFRAEFSHETVKPKSHPQVIDLSRRQDDRQDLQFRQVYIKTGVISQAPGSSYLEIDRTKVICGVYGPRQSTQEYSAKAKVVVDFSFATFSSTTRKPFFPDKTTLEMSTLIRQAIEPSLQLERFPKSIIEINLVVLECNGGVLGACITAASTALADAGILAYDLVSSCSAAIVNKRLVLDPSEIEEENQTALVTVAYMASLDEITQIAQTGEMSIDQSLAALDLCVAGCKKIHEMVRAHLIGSMTEEKTKRDTTELL